MKCEMRVSAAPPQPTWNSLFEAIEGRAGPHNNGQSEMETAGLL